jgi:hypothetical protein
MSEAGSIDGHCRVGAVSRTRSDRRATRPVTQLQRQREGDCSGDIPTDTHSHSILIYGALGQSACATPRKWAVRRVFVEENCRIRHQNHH